MSRPSNADPEGGFDCDLPVDQAQMPPAFWYTSPQVWQQERERLFSVAWLPVAPLNALSEPGASASGFDFGIPWIVLRGQDGVLRAFYNVCRHKAGPLRAENCALTCAYHGWRYDDVGRLVSAPGLGPAKCFNRDAHALAPLGVCTWGPLVFVHPYPQARPLAQQHPEITEALDRTRWSSLQFHGRKAFEVHCNWKVYVDNYLDGGYHIAHMHPSLAAQLDLGSYATSLFDASSVQVCEPTEAPDQAGLDLDVERRTRGGAVYAWLFPNFMVNRYGAALDTNWVVPLSERETLVVYDFFFEPSVLQIPFADQSVLQSAITQEEDAWVCQQVQRGLESGAYKPGRYAPRVEHSEHHFHRLLSRALWPEEPEFGS